MARTYKEYPPSYFSVIERFQEDATELRIELPARDAHSRRHDFYRLGKALSKVIHEDSEASNMHTILRDLVFSIRPPHAKGDEPCELIISFNAMNKAVEGLLGVRDNLTPPKFEEEVKTPKTGKIYDAAKLEEMIRERGEK